MTEQTLPQNDLEPKRGPGRPPKEASAAIPVKKGKKSWSPSNLSDVIRKEDGFRYRWARKDQDNLAKKQAEGWEFVSGVNGSQTTGTHPDSRPDEPHALTSNIERRDAVLMKMDDETAEARDTYINGETERRTAALLRTARQDLGKSGAAVHGSISMEKRGVKTVIKD